MTHTDDQLNDAMTHFVDQQMEALLRAVNEHAAEYPEYRNAMYFRSMLNICGNAAACLVYNDYINEKELNKRLKSIIKENVKLANKRIADGTMDVICTNPDHDTVRRNS